MYRDIQKKVNYGILFFVKYPILGKVKSRLSVEFDENLVVILYKKFVEDLLSMLNRSKFPILICYHPTGSIENFQKWLGNTYKYIPQNGNDLGERLENCFQKGFNIGFERLIVIGSDSPDLPQTIINDSFQILDDYDSVIGPCEDGGYYLLGFTYQSFFPEVFHGINWSTSTVYEKTMKILKEKTLKNYVLPQLNDVDTIDDLKNLYLRNKDTKFKKSKTMKFLEQYFRDKK